MKIIKRVTLGLLSILTVFSLVACGDSIGSDNIVEKAMNQAAEDHADSNLSDSAASLPPLPAKVENDVTKAMTPPEQSIVLASTNGNLVLSNTLTFDKTVQFYENAIPKLGVSDGKTTTSQEEEIKLDIVDQYRATVGDVANFWQYSGTYEGEQFVVIVMGVAGEDIDRSFTFVSYKQQDESSDETSSSQG